MTCCGLEVVLPLSCLSRRLCRHQSRRPSCCSGCPAASSPSSCSAVSVSFSDSSTPTSTSDTSARGRDAVPQAPPAVHLARTCLNSATTAPRSVPPHTSFYSRNPNHSNSSNWWRTNMTNRPHPARTKTDFIPAEFRSNGSVPFRCQRLYDTCIFPFTVEIGFVAAASNLPFLTQPSVSESGRRSW